MAHRVPAHLKVEMVPLGDVRPLERNPRRGDVDFVRGSLRRFGQYVPIIVRTETGEILKGNHTYYALKEEGAELVAIVRRSVPDDDEAQRLALTDNRASDLGDWDVPELASVLAGLPDLEGSGFDDAELVSFIAQASRLSAPETVEDPPAPDPPKRPTTRPGDLIQLGGHRLLCGDALDPADVGRLLDGLEPLVVNTDPPYGVEFDPAWRDRAGYNGKREIDARTRKRKPVAGSKPTAAAEPSYTERDGVNAATKGDTIVDYSPAVGLCPTALVAYVWHADRWTDAVLAGLEREGFERVQMLIWDKEQFVLSRTMYHWQHEPCWVARRAGARVPWHGTFDQPTIIRAPSPKRMANASDEGKWDHPTQKPLATAMPPIANHLLPGQVVYDPFAGSGTSLIAAEHLERRAAVMEIDPGYCDVIVARYEELTGEKASRPARRKRPAKPKK